MRYRTSSDDDEEECDVEGCEERNIEGNGNVFFTEGAANSVGDIESVDVKRTQSGSHSHTHHKNHHDITDPPSRKHSTTSRTSATSTVSQRKKVYDYEDGVVLTSEFILNIYFEVDLY